MCTVSAWPTHYFPLVGVCWALQAAGHEVRVACAPSQAATVAHAGLTPVPVLGELDIAFLARLRNVWDAQAGNWPYPWTPPHPVTGEPMADVGEFDFAAFGRASQERIATPVARGGRAAVALARRWRPDLVLHEPLSMEGAFAARTVGVPSVVHLWGPIGTAESDPVARLMTEYPVDALGRCPGGRLTLDDAPYVVDACPVDLAPPVGGDRVDVRYLPYNGTGAMPEWVLAEPDRPRVSLVWGTSLTRMFGPESNAVPLVLEALADLDVEVVVSTGRDDTTVVPPHCRNVRVLTQFPLHLLLPTCAAVVHHGGAGCLMTSLAAGVPQLTIPTGMDQPVNARRLAAVGASRSVPRDRADPGLIREAVVALLAEPGYRSTAARLADEMRRRPSPADIVVDLEKIAAG